MPDERAPTHPAVAEPELPVVRAVRRAIAAGGSQELLGLRVLDAIGDSLGWLLGALWRVDPADGRLAPVVLWRARVHKPTGFEQATRERRFAPGEGLPGRVLVEERVVLLHDAPNDPNFTRRAAAARESLRDALAFPLWGPERVWGVAEFYTDGLRVPISVLGGALHLIGCEVGAALAAAEKRAGRA